MLQPLGELQRIPTFKDLVRKNPDRVTHGLVSYPVLMAADILGAQADIVPVGSDQIPNVELARNLAINFNRRYGPTFTVPEMLEEMIKVPGLDGEKMGKSDSENAIGISMAREEVLRRYLKRGVTDKNRIHVTDPGNPEVCLSVFPIHKLVSSPEVLEKVDAACRTAKIGCADCKRSLVESIWSVLEPFQVRRAELANQDDYVRDVLRDGGRKARSIIMPTIDTVAERMGIVQY
jgi:tryptophanyl-tRNA synthetase